MSRDRSQRRDTLLDRLGPGRGSARPASPGLLVALVACALLVLQGSLPFGPGLAVPPAEGAVLLGGLELAALCLARPEAPGHKPSLPAEHGRPATARCALCLGAVTPTLAPPPAETGLAPPRRVAAVTAEREASRDAPVGKPSAVGARGPPAA